MYFGPQYITVVAEPTDSSTVVEMVEFEDAGTERMAHLEQEDLARYQRDLDLQRRIVRMRRPIQRFEMCVLDYYKCFCNWKEEMISLGYPDNESSYIDDFIGNLQWHIQLRVSNHRSRICKLVDAYFEAKFEETTILLERMVEDLKAATEINEMDNLFPTEIKRDDNCNSVDAESIENNKQVDETFGDVTTIEEQQAQDNDSSVFAIHKIYHEKKVCKVFPEIPRSCDGMSHTHTEVQVAETFISITSIVVNQKEKVSAPYVEKLKANIVDMYAHKLFDNMPRSLSIELKDGDPDGAGACDEQYPVVEIQRNYAIKSAEDGNHLTAKLLPNSFVNYEETELNEGNDCVVLGKMDAEIDADQVFVEMTEPFLVEDFLGIEATKATHYMFDNMSTLSPVNSDEGLYGNMNSLSSNPYNIESCSGESASIWAAVPLTKISKFIAPDLNYEEVVLGDSVTMFLLFSMLHFSPRIFDPGTLVKQEEYERLVHCISSELILNYSQVYDEFSAHNHLVIELCYCLFEWAKSRDIKIYRVLSMWNSKEFLLWDCSVWFWGCIITGADTSTTTHAIWNTRPFVDSHVGAIVQTCTTTRQAAPRRINGHAKVHFTAADILSQRVPFRDKYCFIYFGHFHMFISGSPVIFYFTSNNTAHGESSYKFWFEGASSKSVNKFFCYCILSLDIFTNELYLVTIFDSWIGLLSSPRADFSWDPGMCIIFIYILEDKDVFEGVGNRILARVMIRNVRDGKIQVLIKDPSNPDAMLGTFDALLIFISPRDVASHYAYVYAWIRLFQARNLWVQLVASHYFYFQLSSVFFTVLIKEIPRNSTKLHGWKCYWDARKAWVLSVGIKGDNFIWNPGIVGSIYSYAMPISYCVVPYGLAVPSAYENNVACILLSEATLHFHTYYLSLCELDHVSMQMVQMLRLVEYGGCPYDYAQGAENGNVQNSAALVMWLQLRIKDFGVCYLMFGAEFFMMSNVKAAYHFLKTSMVLVYLKGFVWDPGTYFTVHWICCKTVSSAAFGKYCDIMPSFVSKAVRHGAPSLEWRGVIVIVPCVKQSVKWYDCSENVRSCNFHNIERAHNSFPSLQLCMEKEKNMLQGKTTTAAIVMPFSILLAFQNPCSVLCCSILRLWLVVVKATMKGAAILKMLYGIPVFVFKPP